MITSHVYLVIGVHFGHHPFLQEVEGQHLKHVQLMCHFRFDRSIPSDDVLEKEIKNMLKVYWATAARHAVRQKS